MELGQSTSIEDQMSGLFATEPRTRRSDRGRRAEAVALIASSENEWQGDILDEPSGD